MEVHGSLGDGPFSTSLAKAVGFSVLYFQSCFLTHWAHWAKEANLVYQNLPVEHLQHMSNWHNVELFVLRPVVGVK